MTTNVCVFCSSSSDLNTDLRITLDNGTSVVVKICDVHAEDATVKSARAAYQEKMLKFEELLAQAKMLGFEISSSNGLMVAREPEQRPLQQPQQHQQPQIDKNNKNVIPTKLLDNAREFKTVGGNVNSAVGNIPVAGNTKIDRNILQDKLPEAILEGHAEMAIMEGRCGQPIAIPQRRIDGTGITNITIVKSDDAALQRRFKSMAQDSMNANGQDSAYGSLRTCGMCNGSGTLRQRNGDITCPKCHGNGNISIY